MNLRLCLDDFSQQLESKPSLHYKIRVKTSRFPKDFFESPNSPTTTRSSSCNRSVDIPETPKFGSRESSKMMKLNRRRKGSEWIAMRRS